MAGVFSQIKNSISHAWNAFNKDSFQYPAGSYGGSFSYARPDQFRSSYSMDKTITASIYTRLSIDVSGIQFMHVRTDDQGRYKSDMPSSLNDCLTVEPNIDQGPRQFFQDIAEVLFNKGVCAIVPVDVSNNPTISNAFDILSMRVGEVVAWLPQHVRVSLYNEKVGYREEIMLPKKAVAIVQNPLYAVMNEPSSTLQRLIQKLNMLDTVDKAAASGKMDMIIQLPYVIKTDTKREQAKQRRTDLEAQLRDSTYGIAYIDGTEKITQLNRPVDNNLLTQIQYLQSQVYAELGLTDEIMNGTANESTMLNYIDRTIKPIADAIAQAMKRSFLSKTARSQGQSVVYFRDPFALVPLSQFAEIADALSRNEVFTPNDLRTAIGWKPSSDPKADQLANSNMPNSSGSPPAVPEPKKPPAIESGGDSQNGS